MLRWTHVEGAALPTERFEDWSDQDIANAYEQGSAIKEIAARLGVAPKTVRTILGRMNVEIRSNRLSHPRPILPDSVIVAQYEDGASTTELAKTYEVSSETIRRLLMRHNVRLRPAHQAIATTANYRQPMTEEQRAEVVRLYQQGLSAEQVAKRMGFASRRTVLNVTGAAGVTRTSPKEAVAASLNSEAVQEIARRHEAGETLKALAEEYSVSRSTLNRRLAALRADQTLRQDGIQEPSSTV